MLETIIESIYASARKSMMDYSNLETTIGQRTFVFRNGTMATVLEYGGVRRVTGKAENLVIVDRLSDVLNPFFLKKAHELHFIMNRDLMSKERMTKKMDSMYKSAERMGLGDVMHDIFDEQAETMANLTMEDTIVIVLYTHSNALRKEDYQEWIKALVAERRKGDIHVPQGTQDETYGIDPMLALHDAFVDQVSNALRESEIGALCKALPIDEASTVMAKFLDPLGVPDEWSAWLLPTSDTHLARRRAGESLMQGATPQVKKVAPKITKIANTSIFFPPPLKEQLICHEGRYTKDGGFLEYGGRLYSTLAMNIPPRRNVLAPALIYALSGMQTRVGGMGSQRVPYRLSIRIRGDGLRQGMLRAMVAPLVSVGSANNIKLMRAYKALQKESQQDNAIGSFSLSLTTWTNTSNPNAASLLKSRVVAMRSAASQWGDMQVVEETIDRVKAFLATCPAITLDPCSNEGSGTMKDLLPLFPWSRPASPLGNDGAEFYRTLDGAILPTEAHSSKQDYWLETMTAPMGGGKSAQANRKHFDFIFAPGRTSLPYLHILDIGGSVSGMVEMIQDALPIDQKHLAYVHLLRNDRKEAVNMLDPKLGLRYPLDADLESTVDWLTALATPAERTTPYENMSAFCRVLLKAAYRRFDDRLDQSTPRLYKPGFAAIDLALAEARIDVKTGTPWYQVSDMLGAKGNYQAAILAHRKAVPLLSDVHSLASDDNLRTDYMNAKTEQGSPIPEAFSVQLAMARESFPMFTDETVLDLRGRRITAIDLAKVATKGSASARKQASLMYMVAYELFSRNIRITPEDMHQIPKEWMSYYQAQIEELATTEKHISIDEYHRTMIQDLGAKDSADHDTQGLRATLVREGGRESRKWGVSLTTISQVSSDHGQLFSLASANHIIKRGGTEESEFQQKALGLSGTDMSALAEYVNGPRKGEGVTFLSQWITKDGRFNQLYTSTIGPKMLWSLSTTLEDKTIRKIVFDGLGRSVGRTVLAKNYPGGTAKDEVDRRKRSIKQDPNDDITESACKEVALEMIAQYRANPANFK